MVEKIIVILVILAAVVGLVLNIRRQRRDGVCRESCEGCALAKECSKKEKKLE